MGLKDNFVQAMKELFGGDGASAKAADEKKAVSPESQLFNREAPEQPAAAEQQSPAETSLESQFEDRMRDMLNSSGLVGADLQAKAQTSTELDSNLRKAEAPVSQSAPVSFTREPAEPAYTPPAYTPPPARPAPSFTAAPAARPAPNYTTAPSFTRETAAEPVRFTQPAPSEQSYSAPAQPGFSAPSQPGYSTPAQPGYAAASQPRYSAPYGQTEQESFPRSSSTGAEVTIISKNTLVTGNIRSFAGIYVEGNVSGNIEVVKNADINGKIIGNVTCSDMRLNGALIQGDVLSKGRVFMDKNAMLVGNMGGQTMDIDGKVKGNVEVGGRIGLRENSVVIGNINAGTIAISDGANVQGFINTTYLRENADKVFPAQITLADEESAFTQPRA